MRTKIVRHGRRTSRRSRDLLLEKLESRCLLAADLEIGSVANQVSIADGVNGLPANTLSMFEFFGTSIAWLGDIDGDDVSDLAVGAPGAHEAGPGAVYVLRRTPEGAVKAWLRITDGSAGLTSGTLRTGDQFGSSLAAVDLDGDGRRELVVGAPGDDTDADATGAAYVLKLNSEGEVQDQRKVANGISGLDHRTLGEGDRFGRSLAPIGDFNGDGVPDIAVGATDTDGNPTDHDAIHLLMMNHDGTVQSQVAIDKFSSGLNGLEDRDNFGISVSGLGDLDSDGVIDLAIGASYDFTGGQVRGAAYLLLMNADGTPREVQKIADGIELPAGTLHNDDQFGYSLAAIGDLDGDGVRELAVASGEDDTGGPNQGAVYLLFLNSDATVKSIRKIADGMSNLADGTTHIGSMFGTALAWSGDASAGGVAQLVVGSAHNDTRTESTGAVHVLELAGHGDNERFFWIDSYRRIGHQAGGFGDLARDDHFAQAVAPIGDLDGDGNVDVAVGVPRYDSDGVESRGAVYVLFLNQNGTVRESARITHGSGGLALGIYDRFGTSVAALGDLDHDGVMDLAVGAQGDDTGNEQFPWLDRGAVYVLLMNRDGTVKSHQKIADHTGGLGSLADSANFGSALASLDDFDGDGVPDLAVGLSTDVDGEVFRGAVYLLMLQPDGTVKRTQKIAHQKGGLGELPETSFFGWSITSLGDLNGDGALDLAVGAFGDEQAGTMSGAVYLLMLNRDGTVQARRKLTGDDDRFTNVRHYYTLGKSLASPGDLNSDGVPDLIIGGSGDSADTDVAGGAIYGWLLNPDGSIRDWEKVAHRTGGFGDLKTSDNFGTSMAAIGDLNRDGMIDLVVGAVGDDANIPCENVLECIFENRGALYVLNLLPKHTTPPPDDAELVAIQLEAVDESGAIISEVQVGEQFFLQGSVDDLRDDGMGVFSAYLDVNYDGSLASPAGPLTFGDDYINAREGRTDSAGLIDDVGAIASTEPLGGRRRVLFRLPMVAMAAGALTFQGDPADLLPAHEVTLYLWPEPVDHDRMHFLPAVLTVVTAVTPATANDDTFTILNDARPVELDVLANDSEDPATLESLTLISVNSPSSFGETVSIDRNRILFTPAERFFGNVEFEYTLRDLNGQEATAKVMVTVGKRWNNQERPTDVNADQFTSPMDALVAINTLLIWGSIELPAIPRADMAAWAFVDANNDRFLSPTDALVVINELNRQAADRSSLGAEAESCYMAEEELDRCQSPAEPIVPVGGSEATLGLALFIPRENPTAGYDQARIDLAFTDDELEDLLVEISHAIHNEVWQALENGPRDNGRYARTP